MGRPHLAQPLDILIIGYGSIAGYVAKQLEEDPRLRLRFGLCRPGREKDAAVVLGQDVQIAESADAITGHPAIAVDCGGHDALRAHGPGLLRRGIDLLTVSNGALADAALMTEMMDSAQHGGARLRLLSGAIGALDAISAARIGGLDSVRYTGRKPPKGWAGSPAEDKLDLSAIREPAVHFEGTAREAALLYPKNANVAATVALAGIGLDRTEARLIADPTIDGNRHEIEARGAFGQLTFCIEGNPLPDNPRSSALTAMSVVRALQDRVDPLTV